MVSPWFLMLNGTDEKERNTGPRMKILEYQSCINVKKANAPIEPRTAKGILFLPFWLVTTVWVHIYSQAMTLPITKWITRALPKILHTARFPLHCYLSGPPLQSIMCQGDPSLNQVSLFTPPTAACTGPNTHVVIRMSWGRSSGATCSLPGPSSEAWSQMYHFFFSVS